MFRKRLEGKSKQRPWAMEGCCIPQDWHTGTQAHEHGQCHVTFLGQGEVLGGSVVNDDMVDVETSFYN